MNTAAFLGYRVIVFPDSTISPEKSRLGIKLLRNDDLTTRRDAEILAHKDKLKYGSHKMLHQPVTLFTPGRFRFHGLTSNPLIYEAGDLSGDGVPTTYYSDWVNVVDIDNLYNTDWPGNVTDVVNQTTLDQWKWKEKYTTDVTYHGVIDWDYFGLEFAIVYTARLDKFDTKIVPFTRNREALVTPINATTTNFFLSSPLTPYESEE